MKLAQNVLESLVIRMAGCYYLIAHAGFSGVQIRKAFAFVLRIFRKLIQLFFSFTKLM